MDDTKMTIPYEIVKIKVLSADIVVHGTVEKPYYEIKYFTLDGRCHIGYSSYDLKNVFGWLEEYFEVIHVDEEPKDIQKKMCLWSRE